MLTLVAGWMAVTGRITPGQLVTVVGLAQFLQGALAHIGTFGANWSHKRASAARLHALIAEDFVLPEGSGAASGPQSPAVLEWKPDASQARRDRSSCARGQMVGVHVEGAAQAREIAALLAFRVAPDPGELLLDGDDALTLGPARYRVRVIAPPHDAAVFTGTLHENVCLTGGPIDPGLASATTLDDVIDHVGSPEAPVGESGRRLSGGQRQRLLLARALHDDAEVVVLDEPTTALDPLTARRVAEGLARLGRTLVVVTGEPPLLAACSHVLDARTVAPRALRTEVAA